MLRDGLLASLWKNTRYRRYLHVFDLTDALNPNNFQISMQTQVINCQHQLPSSTGWQWDILSIWHIQELFTKHNFHHIFIYTHAVQIKFTDKHMWVIEFSAQLSKVPTLTNLGMGAEMFWLRLTSLPPWAEATSLRAVKKPLIEIANLG